MCSGHPGAQVVDFTVGAGSDGTTARRPLVVTYNDIGNAAGLPTALYTKSCPNLLTRFFCGLNALMITEGRFYLGIAPELSIETPRGYHAVWDKRSGRSLLILEDVVSTRGAKFADPTVTRILRSQADDMVDLMANYHAAFWGSPRLDTEFSWLLEVSEWQRQMNDAMGFGRMFRNGLKRSRNIMPRSIVKREADMLRAFMRSVELEKGRPSTLIHQDTHCRNWYFTDADAGPMGLCDWQVNAKGTWAFDVPYALGSCLTTDDRRDWERPLLERYLDKLGAVAPPFNEAWLSYRQQVIHGLAYWLMTIGRIAIQPEFQPREVCVANIKRLSQAAADLDTLDAILQS